MFCVIGCDYLPNLPGIGLQRAKKFFKLTANTDLKTVLYKIPNYLKMSKTVRITEQYVNDFIKAENTFKYQLVFCPKQRKLIPLTPYDNGIRVEDLKYAGTHFDESQGQNFAFEYAIGNVDTKTLKIVDSYCFEAKSDSIWSDHWFSYKKRFTKNTIVLQKLNQNNVITVNCDNTPQKRQFCQTIEREKHSEYFSKRLKVNENGFVNSSKMFDKYSSEVINESNKSIPSNTTTHRSHTSRNQIYSRNIFKVNSDCSEGLTIQSKYFSNKSKNSSREESTLVNNQLNGRLISIQKSQEMSQYSLNSSGNTEINSSFDETLTLSDTERSEISETSDEEIVAIHSFTNLKSKKKGSIKPLTPLNSTLINSSKKSDIRQYFK